MTDRDDILDALDLSDPNELRKVVARQAMELERVKRDRSAMATHAEATAATVATMGEEIAALKFSQASMETSLEEHVQNWGVWSAALSESVSELRGTVETLSYATSAPTPSAPTAHPVGQPTPEQPWTNDWRVLLVHGRHGGQARWLVAGLVAACLLVALLLVAGFDAMDYRRLRASPEVSPSLSLPVPSPSESG